MRTNSATGYGSVARILHWLTALVILSSIVLGLLAHRVAFGAVETTILVFSLHKTLGIAAVTIGTLRILWALTQVRPVPVHPERRAETFVAEVAHWLLYVAMIVVPLAGWAEHAATQGFAPILWPLGQSLPFIPKSEHLAEALAGVHRAFAWVLIVTVALHIAGALKHAVIDRDGVLGRMLTGRRAGKPVAIAQGHVVPALAAGLIFAAGAVYALTTLPEAPAESTAAPLEAVASQWQVESGAIDFSVKQMGTPVAGKFADWTAAIDFDEATGTGKVTVTINMASVTVGTVSDQAKGADFFDTAQYPTAVFTAAIRPEGDAFIAEGTLAMKGAEMPLSLPFTLSITDGVAQMKGETVMDRRDWKVGANYADEATVAFPVTLNVAVTAKR